MPARHPQLSVDSTLFRSLTHGPVPRCGRTDMQWRHHTASTRATDGRVQTDLSCKRLEASGGRMADYRPGSHVRSTVSRDIMTTPSKNVMPIGFMHRLRTYDRRA